MPELPEVETIRLGLAGALVGRRIREVELRSARLRRPLPRQLVRELRGRKVVEINRRGKYLLAHLDNGKVWLMHLGMTGTITITGGRSEARDHAHLEARLDDGRRLVFSDPRRFGLILVGDEADFAELAVLGVEPLSPHYTPSYLYRRCRKSRRRIKDLLMDQRVVAGLGNIYANEILFAAGIRPTRRANRVPLAQAGRLVEATRRVLSRALLAGGSSISDFRSTSGKRGSFQEEFLVYGRAGCPCLACGRVIKKQVFGGRSCFYCPHCQR